MGNEGADEYFKRPIRRGCISPVMSLQQQAEANRLPEVWGCRQSRSLETTWELTRSWARRPGCFLRIVVSPAGRPVTRFYWLGAPRWAQAQQPSRTAPPLAPVRLTAVPDRCRALLSHCSGLRWAGSPCKLPLVGAGPSLSGVSEADGVAHLIRCLFLICEHGLSCSFVAQGPWSV